MNASKSIFRTGLFAASLFFFTSCEKIPTTVDDPNLQDANALANRKGSGGGGGGGESVGNNLSFPVIWAEGPTQTLTLRVPPAGSTTESVVKAGAWWFVWGVDPIDPSSPIFSCQPTPAGGTICIDGTVPGDNSSILYKAYLQKDVGNYWQASAIPATTPVNVDLIDWGDNLESIDWSLSSKVRTEVVLTEGLTTAVTQYAMRHVSGWGVDEVHGLQTKDGTVLKGTGDQATVYSKHARLTIQRLYDAPVNLSWNQSSHAWTGDAYAPVFNKAVWQAADGPGYYNAEVNVKGKVIFGYTWDVNKLNSGAGVYRITFSFDGAEETQAGSPLNTFFDGTTKIVVPVEEVTAEAEEDGGGGTPVIDAANNLTYIDVTISGRGKGGGKR